MDKTSLTWQLVDQIAADLGASVGTRRKWRNVGRGVPASWRIRITERLLSKSVPVSLADFDRLVEAPGRIAA